MSAIMQSVPELQKQGFLGRLAQWMLVDNDPQWLFGLIRDFWPVPRVGGWSFISRYDDVHEALLQDKVFEVPFGDNVTALNGGVNFLLGMSDGLEYRRFRQEVMEAFSLEDVAAHVAPQARRYTEECISAARGQPFDAVEGMITHVPIMISSDYYGLEIPSEHRIAFGRWSIIMSTFLFGNPSDDPALRASALPAGQNMREMFERRLAQAIADGERKGVLGKLIAAKIKPELTPADEARARQEIVAYMIGMVTGFVPTNTMAAGHMLEVLLSNPEMMERTRAAALAGDDDLLKRCLFEAMRFKPLNPGPFRICTQDYVVGEGTAHATPIRAGTKVVVSTQSAMFDERRIERPTAFDPNRPRSDYMLFGRGLHWCIGAYIAEVQITEMFKTLLEKGRPQRAPGKRGKMARLGPFPQHLYIELK